ncbi:MAG: hypothetical protein ACD_63C00042G0002 [uncultured bacterium]|nr:MAG: hypothetical protein ACD_63C00042G0002 [uncultured bacterium]
MLLAIDTTREYATIALGDESGLVDQISWKAGQRLSMELLPKIRDLLGKNKIRKTGTSLFGKAAGSRLLSCLDILVVTGPGSFTGNRIGVATANALAYAWNVPVVGVTAFELYEEAANIGRRETVVVLENIHDLVYASIMPQSDNVTGHSPSSPRLRRARAQLSSTDNLEKEYFVGTVGDLSKKIVHTNQKFIGEINDDLKKKILKAFGKVEVANIDLEKSDRAKILLRSGKKIFEKLGSKKFVLPVSVLYISKPNITIKAKHK